MSGKIFFYNKDLFCKAEIGALIEVCANMQQKYEIIVN